MHLLRKKRTFAENVWPTTSLTLEDQSVLEREPLRELSGGRGESPRIWIDVVQGAIEGGEYSIEHRHSFSCQVVFIDIPQCGIPMLLDESNTVESWCSLQSPFRATRCALPRHTDVKKKPVETRHLKLPVWETADLTTAVRNAYISSTRLINEKILVADESIEKDPISDLYERIAALSNKLTACPNQELDNEITKLLSELRTLQLHEAAEVEEMLMSRLTYPLGSSEKLFKEIDSFLDGIEDTSAG